jgi:ABC-type glutathione transport system ATPase component/predicted amidohydrolase YtcJ
MIDIVLKDLNVTIGGTEILKDIKFTLGENDSVGVVGESGSGKTMLVRSIIGLLPAGANVIGDYEIAGDKFALNARERAWRKVRGNLIGMVMQDPFTALDPMAKCGRQILSGLSNVSRKTFDIESALAEVGLLPDVARKYPFELSGGMRQRVVIAAALATKPKILIADEATTALDVITQSEILDLIDDIRAKRSMPFIMITHNIRLVRERTDRIIVIHDGEVVEEGATNDVVTNPQSDYAKILIAADNSPGNIAPENSSSKKLDINGDPSSRIIDGEDETSTKNLDRQSVPSSKNLDASPLMSADNITKKFGKFTAVDDVSININPGEIVGIVGQSGSGKTTLARCVVGLENSDSGKITYHGRVSPQIVFQDPYSSLNPAHKVEFILKEALKVSGRGEEHLKEIMELAELPEELLDRKPAQLSGGQRQRVAIARSLAPNPELLICDESVSALDILTQNQILKTIRNLSIEKNLAILFITHDLSVVRAFASRIYVMNKSRVVEEGTTEEVFMHTKDDYTKALIAASEYGLHEKIAESESRAPLSDGQSREAAKPTLYSNAQIYTVVGKGWEQRPAEAMAVGADGKILAVGTEPEVVAAFNNTLYESVDLGSHAVLPGFVDTHVHAPGDALTMLFQIYLYDCRGRDETLNAIRKFIREHPERDIYFGTGFYLSIAGGRPEGPRREWLDEIESEKPILLESSDGHSLWLNSAAYRRFGIDKNTPNPTGGIIHKDAETGEPSGTLTDAHILINTKPKYTLAQAEEALRLYQKKMTSWGYTSAMHIAPQFCDVTALKNLYANGEWIMRVNLGAFADHDADIPAVTAAMGEANRYEKFFEGSNLIKTSTIKFFADGVIEGRTAYLKEPYAQINAGEPEDYRSEPLWDKDKLAEAFAEVMKSGYQIHVHSIGDAATTDTLDALEKATELVGALPDGNKARRRDTISHLQVVDAADIGRMKNLGVIASYQPFWHFKEPGWYEQIDLAALGEQRADAAYPVGSCVREGVKVVFSGDYPVSANNDPFSAIQIAVTRNLGNPAPYGVPPITTKDDPKWLRNPNERISLAEAIEAYTINGALALFREGEIGTLEAGKQADFIILNDDPFAVGKVELYKISPIGVYVAGSRVG